MFETLLPSPKIYLAQSKIYNAGRGVFAKETIAKDEVIEQCPIILLNEKETETIRKTLLRNYYFMWGNDKNHHKAGICLGFGSLYNHSYKPNATYKKLYDQSIITFVAIKNITLDEEITVNYNYGNPDDKTTLWIETIPPAA